MKELCKQFLLWRQLFYIYIISITLGVDIDVDSLVCFPHDIAALVQSSVSGRSGGGTLSQSLKWVSLPLHVTSLRTTDPVTLLAGPSIITASVQAL